MERKNDNRTGTRPPTQFRAEAIEEHGVEGSAFDFVSPAGHARLEMPLIGRHNVMNALAALAAASLWGIGATEARRVFPELVPTDKRGEVVRFEDGFTVINDSYNSPWLGDVKGGSPRDVSSEGKIPVGLQGRAGQEVNALGLIVGK